MRLSALMQDFAPVDADLDRDIAAITVDSRKVAPGGLFVAVPGAKTDGAKFILDAVAKGASAIVTGKGVAVDAPVPVLAVDEPRRVLSIMAARFFGRQPETVVAVTGTSGKTSIAAFVRQIFAHAGHQAASVGTIGIVSPTGETYGSLTTPDPVKLSEMMAGLADEGVTHAALEASSHGLDQYRLDGIRLKAGGFTNLSRDHLDYHPTVDDYFAAKMRLFDEVLPDGAPGIVDMDTDWGLKAAGHVTARGLPLIGVGRTGKGLKLLSVANEATGQVLEIDGLAGRKTIHLPLVGTFQASNALVAAGLAIGAGVDPVVAVEALAGLKGASGRLDLVGRTAQGAPVFVDYAHKPGALETVLEALRPATRRKLVVVVGCGGDRDPGKRPMMGEIATRLADIAIITDDNPRSEDPATIRAAIMAAAPGALEIGDRAEAIHHAVGLLGAGDVLVIAGKGHETGQIVGNQVLPFSDHEVAKAAIDEVGG
jgi:UDP-N-acetylmuramoyl-L-alanyl-D-glutamate--2,6-diaminopimelate ligase